MFVVGEKSLDTLPGSERNDGSDGRWPKTAEQEVGDVLKIMHSMVI